VAWCTSRGLDTPECLDAITPAHVIAAFDPVLAAAPLDARYRLEDTSLFDQQLLADRHAELVALRVHNTSRAEVANNWHYLYALSQTEKQLGPGGSPLRVLVVTRDRSELPLAFARRGYESHLCLLDAPTDAPVDVTAENSFLEALRDRVEVSFGGATNMPYASDSFDVVVATALPSHAAAGKRALGELLRVAQPNGLVVLPVTITGGNASELEGPSNFSERALEQLVAGIGLSYLSRGHDLLRSARALRGEIEPIETEASAARPPRSTVGGLSIRKLPAQPRPTQRPERRTHHFVDGVELTMCDYADSFALHAIIDELRGDCYRIKDIPFAPGDVVFDVGAHVGTFSLLLAKKYPFLQIVAFEPFPDNYRHFLENIRLNGVSNIVVYNKAVSGDGRRLSMKLPKDNTGGASIEPVRPGESDVVQAEVESVTLEEMLRRHVPDPGRCKLLKMDCEGAEFEVLPSTPSLNRVDYLSAEFHMSDRLKTQGHSIDELVQLCRRTIPAEHVTVVEVEIG
jgi:FkbM family methyltransferase